MVMVWTTMKELMQKQKAWRESLLVPKSRVVPGSEVGPGSEPVMPPEATETGGGEPRRRGRTSGEALVAGVDKRAGARKGAGGLPREAAHLAEGLQPRPLRLAPPRSLPSPSRPPPTVAPARTRITREGSLPRG